MQKNLKNYTFFHDLKMKRSLDITFSLEKLPYKLKQHVVKQKKLTHCKLIFEEVMCTMVNLLPDLPRPLRKIIAEIIVPGKLASCRGNPRKF